MNRPRALALLCAALAATALTLLGSPALAADLVLNGAAAGPAVCPDGGTPVDKYCQVNATPAANNGCRYGGEKSFGVVSLTNGATLCVAPYNGVDKVNTGNVVLKANSITIDGAVQWAG